MANSSWNHETKDALTDHISSISGDLASLSRQITKGAKAQEVSLKGKFA